MSGVFSRVRKGIQASEMRRKCLPGSQFQAFSTLLTRQLGSSFSKKYYEEMGTDCNAMRLTETSTESRRKYWSHATIVYKLHANEFAGSSWSENGRVRSTQASQSCSGQSLRGLFAGVRLAAGRGVVFNGKRHIHSVESDTKPLFSKILVANRGEIACRVMRTARAMNIPTVAVYSDPDAEARHVRLADEAIRVGPAAAAASYLNVEAILDAIRQTKADAVHPGYGFLSENAAFVRKLEEKGVTFIGPSASAIAAMGDKIESKKLARAAGVNIIPGRDEIIRDADDAVKIARDVGFPVMMKASGGGGGKGMRIAWNEAEVKSQFELCRSEASSSFADDRIFIERYIEEPRHIEIQVMGDGHGNVVWLPERECSIQRRNQKIIEEAPSTFLDASTREAMGEQAVALAKAVGYSSAGTVEFLVDKNKNFFYLEMNTRLQVEHPITECVSGLDLVELMFRSAAGEELKLSQDRAKQIHGWAMEARVYCEHPSKGFLPSTGMLRRYSEPREVANEEEIVRVDGGVIEGDEISMFYDPLMSKLVTWGPNRNSAIATMQKALDHYFVEGPFNNIPFLRCIFNHPDFVAGNISTNFLPQHFPAGWKDESLSPSHQTELVAIAAVLRSMADLRAASINQRSATSSSSRPTSKVLEQSLMVSVGGEVYFPQLFLQPHPHDPSNMTATVDIGEEQLIVEHVGLVGGGKRVLDFLINGKLATVQVMDVLPRGFKLLYKGSLQKDVLVQRGSMAPLQKHMPPPSLRDHSMSLLSPMPGSIVEIAVEPGQEVLAGDELVTIEAMKMRNVLRAEESRKISKLHVQVGSTVAADDAILDFE